MEQRPGETRKQFYQRYMKSSQWAKKKKQYRNSGMPQNCQGCGSDYRLHMHHRSYKRLGNERLHDLVPVCENCHNKIHINYDEQDGIKDLWRTSKKVLKKERRRYRAPRSRTSVKSKNVKKITSRSNAHKFQ